MPDIKGESQVISKSGMIQLTGPGAYKSIAAGTRMPTYCGYHVRPGEEALEGVRECNFCADEREKILRRSS
jgi:hypothetical protein